MDEEQKFHHDILYSVLCDFYFYETHPDVKEDGCWHRDEQAETFAEIVMKFVQKELEHGRNH